MRPFAAVERFFERLFERPSARLFHTRLQPIQLQRRVERAMENGRLTAADRVVVPNRYIVRLAPADLNGFGDFVASLELELADAALRFARAHRYTLADRPAVRLRADGGVDPGDLRVDASFSDGAVPASSQPSHTPRSAAPRDAKSPGRPAALSGTPGAGAGADGRAGVRAAGRPRGATPPPPVLPPIDATRTMIFDVPTVEAPLAVLREVSPDGTQRELTLDGGPVTIGRATDNHLVLRDSRVSRYHGRLQARQGALVYSDLGSTNGSRVNGIEIDEVVLGAGDRIELGDTILVVESVPTA